MASFWEQKVVAFRVLIFYYPLISILTLLILTTYILWHRDERISLIFKKKKLNFVVGLQKCEYSNGKFLGAKSCCSQGILLELLLPPYFHSDITHSDHILCHRDERISSASSRWLLLYLFPFCANVLTSYHNGSKSFLLVCLFLWTLS